MHRLLCRALGGGITAVGALILASCGDPKGAAPAAPSATAPAPSSTVLSPAVPAQSPLSVVVDARDPLVLSGMEGGLVVAARAHWAHAAGGGELVAGPVPDGLPEGPGRILGAAGRLLGPMWVLYETQREGGKADKNPLFRLGKEGFKKFADDWRPAIVPWTKHRILAASTSSGKLKIKVIEPSLPAPPDDLPSSRLADASCETTLRVEALAALPTGEVFAAGSCKPDTGAGAGASATRYVVIRWGSPAPPAATAPAPARDAGDTVDGGVPDRPGAVDVIPGVSVPLTHEVLYAHGPADVWAAARDPATKSKPTAASRLFHYDGATWGAVALPPETRVRGLARTDDGTLWMMSDHALFRRPSEGAWSEVPLPSAMAGDERWETFDLASPDGRHVWLSARWTTAGGVRHVVLRSRPTPEPLRWD